MVVRSGDLVGATAGIDVEDNDELNVLTVDPATFARDHLADLFIRARTQLREV